MGCGAQESNIMAIDVTVTDHLILRYDLDMLWNHRIGLSSNLTLLYVNLDEPLSKFVLPYPVRLCLIMHSYSSVALMFSILIYYCACFCIRIV